MKTRIGIVTISFNQMRFLPETVTSVSADRHDLQYVIVDPGSSDGALAYIAANHNRFSATVLEPDQGPADGLNKGFAKIDADILGYINSDDRYLAQSLDFVGDFFAANPDTDVLLGGCRIIDEHGSISRRARLSNRFDAPCILAGTAVAIQQATFFRASAFLRTHGFNIANRTCWDLEILADMAIAGCRFTTISKILGDFRIHSASITGSGRLKEQYEKDLERIEDKLIALGYHRPNQFSCRVEKMARYFSPRRRYAEFFHDLP